MKAALTAWLERRWYGGQRPEWPLRAISRLYGLVARRKRARFLASKQQLPRVRLPVIVVGNLSVGGAGKTPLTLALIEALRRRGWRPGVISRGYGGTAPGPERVQPDSDPARVGDEPALIAIRSGAPVAIARQRVAAARLLEASQEVDVLIADDGLQHYALVRDIEIAVIDGQRRHGNGELLPAGPLREPLARAQECDFRVNNGGEPGADEVGMRLELEAAQAMHGGESKPLEAFRGQRVHAVAAIGNPARFFTVLRARGIDVIEHAFPDHHAFRAADLKFAEPLPVLMTEKDAVKCRAFALPEWYYVPVEAQLPEAFFDAVDARLRDLR